MKFTIKTHKFLKIKNYFKTSHFFFISNSITPKNNILITQKLKKLNLKSCKFDNNLVKFAFRNSIYSNYLPIIKSLIKLILYNPTINIKALLNLTELTLIGLKLNNKLYSIKQINLPIKFNYIKNCNILMKLVKIILKQIQSFNFSK